MIALRHVYTRPKLYAKQFSSVFNTSRYSLVEASTKSGKTHACIVWLFEQASKGKKGHQYFWVAPVYHQATIAYRRMRDALPRGVSIPNDSRLTITLATGAVISFRSGEKPDTLYGDDVWAMVIDEASRLRREAWHACRSTLTATRGPVRIIGNVRGRRNWFYEMARRAETGEAEMAYHRITADDAVAAGVLERSEIIDAQSALPADVYRELYYAEASDDQGNPFGIGAIEQCISPLSTADVSLWAWDLAKRQDWTVGIGLDEHSSVAAFERFQRPWEETVRTIAHETSTLPALIDATGVGDPIVERLQRFAPRIEGFIFTAQSKQQIMEGLAVAIQHREVTYPDGPIAIELRQFGYVYTRTGVRYSAPDGMHDDCVCALAMAVHLRARIGKRVKWLPGDLDEPQPAAQEEYFYER